jgi:pentapeptide repeat protein
VFRSRWLFSLVFYVEINNSLHRKKAAVILDGANLRQTHLEGAILYNALMRGTSLQGAFLQKAQVRWARMEGSRMREAHLEEADLHNAHLEGVTLKRAFLNEADLSKAFFDTASSITTLGPPDAIPLLAEVRWGGVNLTQIDWSQVTIIGDERIARKQKRGVQQLEHFHQAVRAYRKLALELQAQGLNEEATRFAYRAQTLQRRVFRLQFLQRPASLRQRIRMLKAWLFSWFLFVLAGYGYKPTRSFLVYLFTITSFALIYYMLAFTTGPALSPLGAFVLSMTSFHGRGFFPGNHFSLDDPLIVFSAVEALVGLIVEVTFIATLTQRLFNR